MTTIRFQASAGITLPTTAGVYSVSVDDASGNSVMGAQLSKGDQPSLTDLRLDFSAIDPEPVAGDTEGQLVAGLSKSELTAAGIDVDKLLEFAEPGTAGDPPIAYELDSGTEFYIDPDGDGDETAPDRLQKNVIGSQGITISRTLSLKPATGPTGTEVTVTGKGFSGSSAQIWLDNGRGTSDGDDEDTVVDGMGNGLNDATEHTLASSVAIKKGTFSHTFTVDSNFMTDMNPVAARDSNGNAESADYDLTGSLSLNKESAARGSKVTFKLANFANGKAATVTKITIGGQAISPIPDDAEATAGKGEFEITIPSTTPLGEQQVRVESDNEDPVTAKITISSSTMTISPPTAVPGQEVTVTGSGFGKGVLLKSIHVDGMEVERLANGPEVATQSVLTDGTVVVTFDLPKGLMDGQRIVRVTDIGDRIGDAILDVPKRTITLNPAESRRGTSVTVEGKGFLANSSVTITYGETTGSVGLATADGSGNWSTAFKVPADALLGITHEVTADDTEGSQTEDHKIPDSGITLSPESGQSGSTISIEGFGFPIYTSVNTLTIGNISVIPVPAPSTDAEGDFSTTVTVPGLNLGTQVVKVTVGDKTSTAIYTVLEGAPAAVPVATTFKSLVDAGNLERVYHYVNATATWLVFDPRPDFAEFNDYTESTSGQAVWVKVTNDAQFQGQSLFAGWNLIVLR
jgi:hypothetical protein